MTSPKQWQAFVWANHFTSNLSWLSTSTKLKIEDATALLMAPTSSLSLEDLEEKLCACMFFPPVWRNGLLVDGIVSRQIRGKLQKMLHWSSPRAQWPLRFLNLFPEDCHPAKLWNRRRKIVGREVTENPIVTMADLQRWRQAITARLHRPWLYGVVRQKPLLVFVIACTHDSVGLENQMRPWWWWWENAQFSHLTLNRKAIIHLNVDLDFCYSLSA